MSLINRLSIRLQNHPKRIVYAEGADPRIIQAARLFVNRGLGAPILLGDRSTIKKRAEQLDIKLDGIRILEPGDSDHMEGFIQKFQGLRRFRGFNQQEAREYLLNTSYFATMMLATNSADALVSGATDSASSALRPLFRIIPMQKSVDTASSILILEKEDERIGVEGALFLSDCGVIPDPNQNQLSDMAITTALLAKHLTNEQPRVAMLSYASKKEGTKNPSLLKMKSATALARDKARSLGINVDIDGELQVDAALIEGVAEQKGISSSVAGKANVLIFPDLNSGNIAAKLAQIVADCRAYGQIITGLSKPAAEISRGASAHDIFGASVIVAAQAVDPKYLFPME
ncbi:MAG: phosphate acyltransferase [Verrucomicrobiota bacterium]